MTQVYTRTCPVKPVLPQAQDLSPALGDADLNREIVPSQSLDLEDAAHANPSIIPENTESGQLMVRAIPATHVSAPYTATDFLQQLQLLNENLEQTHTRLAGIENHGIMINKRLDEVASIVNANAANCRIISYNSTCTSRLWPLQKTIPGHGHAKALSVSPVGIAIQQPPVAADIGLVPTPFDNNISAYTHAQILDLIIFYNDDFGIVPGEALSSRQNKVLYFLAAM